MSYQPPREPYQPPQGPQSQSMPTPKGRALVIGVVVLGVLALLFVGCTATVATMVATSSDGPTTPAAAPVESTTTSTSTTSTTSTTTTSTTLAPTTAAPAPAPRPAPAPAPAPRPAPAPAPQPAPAPDPAPRSVSYANCTEARAAGPTPIYRGQPGYASHLDRDNDGVACE